MVVGMNYEEIGGNIGMLDKLSYMSLDNLSSIIVLIKLYQCESNKSDLSVMLLDILDIRGIRICFLYNDCCGRDLDKFNRTLDALDSGIYTREEIDANFADFPIIPFLDDSIELAGIDSSYKDFGPNDDGWYDYLCANRERVLPKLLKKVKRKERNI